jgi:predicted phage tail protein
MATARRSGGGGGAVIAAIFGWILAIGMAVLALFIYQKLAALENAVAQNQKAFEDSVAEYFAAVERPLQKVQTVEVPIRYDEDAYAVVRQELEKAKHYEALVQLLGWKTDRELDASVRSYLQDVGEAEDKTEFTSVRSLLEYYSKLVEQYRRDKNALVDKYNKVLSDHQAMLNAEQRQVAERRKEAEQLRKENEAKFTEYAGDVANARKLWKEAVKERDERAREVEQVKLALKKQVADLEKTQAELRARIAQLEAKKEPERELKAQGEVLEVKSQLNAVYISGGRNVGRERNQQVIVYSESPLGERISKGVLLIKAVYDYTSMGSMLDEDEKHPVIEGDLYVEKSIWDQNRTGAAVAKTPPAAAPAAEKAPEEAKEEPAKPEAPAELPELE